MIRSTESASTPISAGGYRYNPADPQDVADFTGFTRPELEELAREHGYDFSQHPAIDPGETDYGILTDYRTGHEYRPATAAEHARSRAAGETGAYADPVLGTVFVAGGPDETGEC